MNTSSNVKPSSRMKLLMDFKSFVPLLDSSSSFSSFFSRFVVLFFAKSDKFERMKLKRMISMSFPLPFSCIIWIKLSNFSDEVSMFNFFRQCLNFLRGMFLDYDLSIFLTVFSFAATTLLI